jgi:hypothetical protein
MLNLAESQIFIRELQVYSAIPHSFPNTLQQSDQLSISETHFSYGITCLSKYIQSVSNLNLLILKSIFPSYWYFFRHPIMCDLALTCVVSQIPDSSYDNLEGKVFKCGKSYRKKIKVELIILSPMHHSYSLQILFSNNIIFSFRKKSLIPVSFCHKMLSTFQVCHIVPNNEKEYSKTLPQDAPGIHFFSSLQANKTEK